MTRPSVVLSLTVATIATIQGCKSAGSKQTGSLESHNVGTPVQMEVNPNFMFTFKKAMTPAAAAPKQPSDTELTKGAACVVIDATGQQVAAEQEFFAKEVSFTKIVDDERVAYLENHVWHTRRYDVYKAKFELYSKDQKTKLAGYVQCTAPVAFLSPEAAGRAEILGAVDTIAEWQQVKDAAPKASIRYKLVVNKVVQLRMTTGYLFDNTETMLDGERDRGSLLDGAFCRLLTDNNYDVKPGTYYLAVKKSEKVISDMANSSILRNKAATAQVDVFNHHFTVNNQDGSKAQFNMYCANALPTNKFDADASLQDLMVKLKASGAGELTAQ